MGKQAVVILGPTATGKSDLAVEVAKELGGEIISADSRQVYKGLDIGSGKITKEEMKGVPHYLLDVADPRSRFTVIDFVDLAKEALAKIREHGNLPIICGGTGFYIDALIGQKTFPHVPANEELRTQLSNKSADELYRMLEKIDLKKAESLNESDRNNPRRLIRAIEIAQISKSDTAVDTAREEVDPILIGLTMPPDNLRKRIRTRLEKRIAAGMIDEIRSLHDKTGLSWERLDELGLEYRYVSRFLRGQLAEKEMIEKLAIEIGKYAKRQMTWFRRDKRIIWFDVPADQKALIQAVKSRLNSATKSI